MITQAHSKVTENIEKFSQIIYYPLPLFITAFNVNRKTREWKRKGNNNAKAIAVCVFFFVLRTLKINKMFGSYMN